MARRRFFVHSIHGSTAQLRGDEARHLTRVLRVEPGQRYEISDNQSAYLAEIVEARGDRVEFRILAPLEAVASPVLITLCAALIKFDRFEWIIEKATELGVHRVLPVETTRSEKGLAQASRKRSDRWKRIARESSQQARRVSAPEILPAAPFDQVIAEEADQRYFLEEDTAPALFRLLPSNRSALDRVALLVGPEGGWVDAERQAALSRNWLAASLSPQVLRAETAATAAVAIIANAWMV